MKLDIREAIDEANRVGVINKNLTDELTKAVQVVDSQQREIHHLRAINHTNMGLLIDLGRENRELKEKLDNCSCGKPDIKPEKYNGVKTRLPKVLVKTPMPKVKKPKAISTIKGEETE